MTAYDVLVIGAGHNGLVAAGYLAKAGLRVLVFDRREEIGGTVETSELVPGVRGPRIAHTVGRLRASVISDLGLEDHGLELISPPVRAFAPQPDGRAVTLWADVARTADGLRSEWPQDARSYFSYDRRIRTLARFLGRLFESTPVDLKYPSLRDGLTAVKLGHAYKSLDRGDAGALLRVIPMAVADFVAEFFESDALRGVMAARGVQYAGLGPWSAGTAGVLIADSAGIDAGAAGQTIFARGGPGALSAALASAARAWGAQFRLEAEVVAVSVRNGRACGVTLASGEELEADVIVSGADPKHTLLDLLDPVVIGPSLRWRAGNLRLGGVVAKVNLVLAGLPSFTAARSEEHLHGRIVIAPGIDYLERAFDASKYGRVSEAPYLEATIPSLTDQTLSSGGVHVMSVIAQYAPYHLRKDSWEDKRADLGDLVLDTLDVYAPGIGALVTHREVLTPMDLERGYGLTEGHPLHGEPALDQFYAWRPLLGHARYRLAVEGLYLCGSGAHPGGGVTGAPGANAAREILQDLRGRKRPRANLEPPARSVVDSK